MNKRENCHVKFVSYTGEYPILCSGKLTLEIDGVIYTFRGYENNISENVYQKF